MTPMVILFTNFHHLFMFPFTFTVPGISNPFTPIAQEAALSKTVAAASGLPARAPLEKIPISRQRPPRSTSPSPPMNKKRGWEPSFGEPTYSTTHTTLASSSGYLDTPSKYRDMANLTPNEIHEIEEMAEEMPPPAKRRRGLAGSIVSTAVSAALIGTAVGLTVYRLWRDRGTKSEQELLPPPPYHPGEWQQNEREPSPVPQPPRAIHVQPPTPRRKPRLHQAGSLNRRVNTRRTRARVPAFTPPPTQSRAQSTAPAIASSSSSTYLPEPDMDDQMDWIGGKLSLLIEEGKKALGTGVVVMSEAPEDGVDNGDDDWEEEDSSVPSSPRKRSRNPYAASSASPRSSRFSLHSRDTSLDQDSAGGMTPSASLRFAEDTSSWASPELRASMEQARANALRNRGL
ncbi:hypothetical protein CYLTODRAFT_420079, partial [Cylindrobasidium torrendii FP15055 ss-10]